MSSFSTHGHTSEMSTTIMVVWKTPRVADVQETFTKTLGGHGIRTDNLKRQITCPSNLWCIHAPALFDMQVSH